MIKLDRWLLERVFEPAACEVESWTGIHQFQVARFFALVGITADAAKAINASTPADYAVFGLSLFAAGCLVAMTFMAQHQMGRRGTGNWLKHSRFMSVIRCIQFTLGAMSVLLTVLSDWLSLTNVSSMAVALAWGFMSGDRLPPKERHVFQPAEAPQTNA